jgi:hypothetical protein
VLYCLQDVPSFLQETTTIKGQLAYATPALREKARVPPGLDESDDVALAQMELLVPIDEMARHAAKARTAPPEAGTGVQRCVIACCRGGCCVAGLQCFLRRICHAFLLRFACSA